MDVLMDVGMEGLLDGWIVARVNGLLEERMVGWMGGLVDGWVVEWVNGLIDVRKD